MVYVSSVELPHALIFDGAQFEPLDTEEGAGAVSAVWASWEGPHLAHALAIAGALERNHAAALDRIARVHPPPGRLLDFGCGFGLFLRSAQGRGWDVAGIDPLPGRGAYARAALGLDVVTDTLRDGTFTPASFDVITAFQVFEHLPRPGEALDRLARLLAPGGHLLIEVPNIDTWSVRLLGRRHRHFVPDHLSFFSADTLRAFLGRHGFDVVDVSRPTRYLSVRHLVDVWLARGASRPVVASAHRLAGAAGLLDRVVPVNLGDIVMVIARWTGS